MDNLLVPDTPAGQISSITQEEMEEPSCCSPTRSKLKTSPIKVFSLIHIVCGVLAIGLGIVACVFGCKYPGAAIVAGVAFVATGVVGMRVVKHGVLPTVYGSLSVFSFVMSIVLMTLMLAALPRNEGEYGNSCSSYDCRHGKDHCCYDWVLFIAWGNVAVDVAILVVAVVELVASLLATTMSLRNTSWVKCCCLKSNMDELQAVQRTSADSTDESSPLSGQSPPMKRFWKPCESKGHRNLTITLSVIDIIIGVICVAIGIFAVFVETRFAHVGIPIWSGLLIFAVTGIFGLLSVTKKGAYIPFFFSLSILAFLISLNMFSWASDNISQGYYVFKRGCIDWSCNTTITTVSPYNITRIIPNCYDCLPGCCQNGNIYKAGKTNKILLDSLTVGFGVLEMLICMVTIGLSFSQLSCYVCCRCSCCPPVKVVMTPNGELVMLAVSKADGVPTIGQNQQVMVQHQPVVIPNQHIAAQSPPTSGIGELTRHEEQQVHGAQQPVTVQAQGQPITVRQGQGQPMFQQPMFVQGVGQVGMVQGQGQPTNQTVMIPGEGQTLHTVTQAQIPNPEQQIQATGGPADTGEAMSLVAGQDAGSILNPTV